MTTYPGTDVVPFSDPGGVSLIVRDGRLDDAQRELIRKRICKEATDLDLTEFFWTCEKYALNPFGRAQIWAYPRGGQLVIQIGINGDRLIAARSGQYEGQTEPEWCRADGIWRGMWNDDTPPAAARVGVWRKGARFPTYAVANYREFKQNSPLWKEKPAHMLAKVAEHHALLKCFQQEFAELASATFDPEFGEPRLAPPARTADLYGEAPPRPVASPPPDPAKPQARMAQATVIAATSPADAPAQNAEPPRMSDPQRRLLFKLAADKLSWTEDNLRAYVRRAYGHEHITGLSVAEASQCIDEITAGQVPAERGAIGQTAAPEDAVCDCGRLKVSGRCEHCNAEPAPEQPELVRVPAERPARAKGA